MCESTDKRIIVVLGMHRSGTSAITRSLQVIGVGLGNNLPPGAIDNEKGFWEDGDIKQLNDEMLNQISSHWSYFLPISHEETELLISKGYLSTAKQLLLSKIEQHPILGIKDPRLVKLLSFWKKVFSSLDVDTFFIIALRNPLSVSKSLNVRNGFPLEQGCLMWIEHILTGLAGTFGEKRVLVDYDRLMENPTSMIEYLSKATNLPIDMAKLEEYVTEFLDPNLRHTTFSLDELQTNRSVPTLAYDIYVTLSNLEQDVSQLSEPSLVSQLAEWNSIMAHQKQALILVNYYHDKYNQADFLLREKTYLLSAKENELVAIYSSKTWRVSLWLRKVWLWLAPAESIQSRFGKRVHWLMRMLLKLLKQQFQI